MLIVTITTDDKSLNPDYLANLIKFFIGRLSLIVNKVIKVAQGKEQSYIVLCSNILIFRIMVRI